MLTNARERLTATSTATCVCYAASVDTLPAGCLLSLAAPASPAGVATVVGGAILPL